MNLWFKEECKATRKTFRKNPTNENLKRYEHVVKTKKDQFMKSKQDFSIMVKKNPNTFWRELMVKREEQENDTLDNQWLLHAKNLYEMIVARKIHPKISTKKEVFTKDEVVEGIK
jgi:hypothetical protein